MPSRPQRAASSLRRGLILALSTVLGATALAQAEPEPERRIAPDLGQLVAERALRRELRTPLRVRWDGETGTPERVELQRPLALEAEGPREAAWEFLERLQTLYGPGVFSPSPGRGPRLHLRLVSLRRFGDRVAVDFEQRCGEVPIHGGALRVMLARPAQRALGLSLSGRVYRDLPRLLQLPAEPAAPGQPLRLEGVALPSSAPRLVLTPRGGWQLARWSVQEGPRGRLHERLRDARGALLLDRPWGAGGHVEAEVVLRDPRSTRARRGLAELLIHGSDGRLHRSDPSGSFPAPSGSLLGALVGRWEGVAPRQATYPSGPVISLGAAQAEEATAYFHLRKTRLWLERHVSQVPGLEAGARARSLALTNPARAGAWALPSPAEVGGQTYDYTLVLGNYGAASTALDPTVISHERGHSLLYGLGFTGTVGTSGALHEGLADYFSALVQGERIIGRYSIGAFARDLRELRRWPEHEADEAQTTGRIFSGALLDARDAFGERVDRAVLAAIPGFTSATDFFAARDQIFAIAPRYGLSRAQLLPHFARHGLGDPEAGARAPLIEARVYKAGSVERGHELIHFLDSESVTIEFVATSADERRVELTISGLDGLADEVPSDSEGSRTFVTRAPSTPGIYLVTAHASDDRQLRATLTTQIWVRSDEPLTSQRGDLQLQAPIDVPVGFSAAELAAAISPDLAPSRVSWRLSGRAALGAEVDASGLHVLARPGEEGRYSLILKGTPADVDGMIDRYQLEVEVQVGENQNFLVVHAPAPSDQDEVSSHYAPLWPGSELSVNAGGALELRLGALGPARAGGVELALEGELPPGLSLLPQPGKAGEVQATALLIFSPSAAHPIATLELSLVSRAGQEVLARRRLRVHVVPQGADAPPVIEAPASVPLVVDQGTFEARVSDPEGGAVRLEVAWPLPDVRPAAGQVHLQPVAGSPGTYRVSVERLRSGPFTIYLRATDAAGGRSLRAIQAVEAEASLGSMRGLKQALDGARERSGGPPDREGGWGGDEWNDEGWQD